MCIQINGELTLGENIADNGGVHIAFQAYKKVMSGTSEQHFNGHSADQLFFVAFAQVRNYTCKHAASIQMYYSYTYIYNAIQLANSIVNYESQYTYNKCGCYLYSCGAVNSLMMLWNHAYNQMSTVQDQFGM